MVYTHNTVFKKTTMTIMTNCKDSHFFLTLNIESYRTINHATSRVLAVAASFYLHTSSQDMTAGSETVWGDSALLWFNPLLEGHAEIRNSYDSLFSLSLSLLTFICARICAIVSKNSKWRKYFFETLSRETRRFHEKREKDRKEEG